MLRSVTKRILLNCISPNKFLVASVAYQFKVKKPYYYPDRKEEMKRMNEQAKSQLVAEPQKPKALPKDHYYRILGVTKYASTPEIKAAYYSMAKRYHPDSGSQSKRFTEISNAYHILTDEIKRMEYDQLGMVKDEQSFLQKANLTTSSTKPKKQDLQTQALNKDEILQLAKQEPVLELSFTESAHGVTKNVDLRFLKKCFTCNGKSPKLANRTRTEPCRKCGGSGQISKKTSTYTTVSDCDACKGRRFINRNKCDTCDNRGYIVESVRVVVPVPSGLKTGDVLPIENPKTKQRVNYRIQVKESEYFRRIGNDIHTEKYVNISQAILGGNVTVRGIYGTNEVKIEPGTESHSKIVLKGKGIKERDSVGDHVVLIKIRVPKAINMKQRQIVLALSKTEEPNFDPAV
ncbi:dnaJ homolog subfamily A member 3, mitochondrial [Teleopsis dalmanni]|uniref:dnaJ homolog subfamily A member 3, mitochondrial n=1 Tax=Teleopsis dalmanni TaxID=139649 RepID=UPI000D32CF9D|nr:dnaJ homolog subfamily A member 3, mitochondrial [Teleopsis dalmanni]